ncbi:spore_II_D, stage II sporulation protein D [Candidatus Nanopelagicaceae bacterium]
MRMFKPFLLSLAVVVSTLTPAHAEVPLTFGFSGSGYGHGVGMSQIGARARAISGESATAILTYYYKGVSVIPVVDTHTIRVNVGHLLKSASFSVTGTNSSIQIFEGDIGESTTATPMLTHIDKKRLNFRVGPTGLITSPVAGSIFTVRWTGQDSVISLSHTGKSVRYRHGQMAIKVVKGAMEITNSLALRDQYLWGISEVPSGWPPAVLEAQAIASRSYALSKISTIKASCDCHVYDHITDQNFAGFSKESEAKVGALWKAAVNRTIIDTSTSLAAIAKGKPIQAYFFSSSGGATQSTLDAWGTATSYTHSVPDAGSLDLKLNPRFVTWSATTSQELAAKAFLLKDVVSLEIISRNSAGAVTYIKGTSSDGSTKLLRGDTFRSRVKIPSPYFNLTQ